MAFLSTGRNYPTEKEQTQNFGCCFPVVGLVRNLQNNQKRTVMCKNKLAFLGHNLRAIFLLHYEGTQRQAGVNELRTRPDFKTMIKINNPKGTGIAPRAFTGICNHPL